MRRIDADELKKSAYRESGAESIAEMVVTVNDIDDAPTVPAITWHYLPELPKESDYYMITWEGIIGERYVSIAWYDADENHFIDTCYREDYYKVKAWTEPPTPAERKEETK